MDSRDSEEITNNGKTSIFGRTDGGFFRFQIKNKIQQIVII